MLLKTTKWHDNIVIVRRYNPYRGCLVANECIAQRIMCFVDFQLTLNKFSSCVDLLILALY